MKVCYPADADLDRTIVLAVARLEPAVDFQTAHAAGLEGVDDPDVLGLAAATGRVLVSHDRRTMPLHFAEFLTTHECPGVLIVPQKLPASVAAEELVLIWTLTEAEEWVNRICAISL